MKDECRAKVFSTTQLLNNKPLIHMFFADDAIRQEILAKPVITGFSPKQLRAGTRDTLTITGMNFGTTKGKIWFPNSDTGYVKYIEVLNDPDIISWTNTQIKTLVPSYTNMDKSCAGSGRFIVQAASSVLDTMKSIDSLEIRYAIENYRSASSSTPYRMNLVDTNRQGGLTFRYHPNFSSKPKAALCFGEALKKWRCATGVNFIVGKDTTLANIGGDGVNVVNFASASDFASLGFSPTTLAVTFSAGDYYYTCADANTDGTLFGYAQEIDMLFKESTTFWYMDTVSTTTIPAGKHDFMSVCLHEQGHGHRLGHAIGGNKVMIWAIAPQERRRNLTSADLAGGLNVVDSSAVLRPPFNPLRCKPLPMRRVSLANCTTLTALSEITKSDAYFMEHYPNPTSDAHNIHFELEDSYQVSVKVYDMLGKRVLQERPQKFDAGKHTISIDCASFHNGFYLLEVTIGQSQYTTKFVKN
jgi:hypothetical protein